jgi:4-hydroxy-3-methylbut-2-enyl diphosphate reductase
MCFGVRDAIALAAGHDKPVTVLGDLAHNERVMGELREKGIQIAGNVGEVRTPTVMVTAHGASLLAMNHARARGLEVVEATCPLVHFAHRAVAELVADGFHPVIIGRRDHVEVRGITEDLVSFDVVLTEADVMSLPARPKIGIASQTTQPIDKVEFLVGLICRRFPGAAIRFIDTVCQPTKQRQNAAIELAGRSDVMVVIGGARSNNTHELVKTCSRYCARVHHVQSAGDLREEWFQGAQVVGVTAGTSTPEASIAEVESWLGALDRGSDERPAAAGGAQSAQYRAA